jgi:glycine dehydrogenase subunit 1
MSYLSHTDADRKKMLETIGARTFADLIDDIPERLRLGRPLDIAPLSEMEVLAEIDAMSRDNGTTKTCFAGGGVYDHFIPAAVGAIVSRPEFMTAYTPYQAEVSQGTLQVIYEFQTHICRLTGMDVANASMYDGATAAAEAALLCTGKTRRNKVVVSETVSPLVREVLRAYLEPRAIQLVTIESPEGTTDLERLTDALDDQTACVIAAQPNFFGLLEDVDRMAELVHEAGGKFVMAVDPIAQAILKTPGEIGADVVVGEGQPLGIPLSFGGPLLGFFAAKKELVRLLPGRLVARTKDIEGKTGFVLTLQTREQHIRRQKATSNICTNQALCATTAAVYLSLMGRTGLKRVALLSAERAQQTARRIAALDGFEVYHAGPFVREFCVRTPLPAQEVVLQMAKRGILAGIDAGRWYPDLKDCLIVAVTEKRTEQEIAAFVDSLGELAKHGVLSGVQN